MEVSIINPIEKLIDDVCCDNDYILTFQTTQEVRDLATELLLVRNNKFTELGGVKCALDNLANALLQMIKLTPDKNDLVYDIFEGVERSLKRYDEYIVNMSK